MTCCSFPSGCKSSPITSWLCRTATCSRSPSPLSLSLFANRANHTESKLVSKHEIRPCLQRHCSMSGINNRFSVNPPPATMLIPEFSRMRWYLIVYRGNLCMGVRSYNAEWKAEHHHILSLGRKLIITLDL